MTNAPIDDNVIIPTKHILQQGTAQKNQTNEQLIKNIKTYRGADGWVYRCIQLIRYKLDHNDDCSSLSLDYKAPDDLTLGQWADQQKRLYREGRLALERISYLESQGFNFDRTSPPPVGAVTGDEKQYIASMELVRDNKKNNDDGDPAKEDMPRAELCPTMPVSLHLLWEEYTVGVDGRKPAKQFTKGEINVNKPMATRYCRRNNVWQCIQRLMDTGLSAEVAIDRIYNVYGYLSSPSKIIKEMVADKGKYHHDGFHPGLYLPVDVAERKNGH